MSQSFKTPYASGNIPGTYVNYQVLTQPTGVSSSGIAVIMGEANGGPSYEQTTLANSVYTPDQLDKVTQVFTSGQMVDAFTALTVPSNDPNITGTATRIYCWKTNTGTMASATLQNAAPATYGTLSDINWGTLGNQDQYQVLAVDAEVAPTVQGSTIPMFGAALDGITFNIRLNGGTSTVVGPVAGSPANVAALVIELNTLLPSGITASAGTAMNSIALTMAVDAMAWDNGWGKSFELIDSTPGDLAALGLVPALNVSSQEPSIELQDSNLSRGVSETLEAAASIALMVGYAGTTATMTINQTTGMLTTTVTGGSGAALSIALNQYTTIGQLATFIASQPGYSATVVSASNQQPTSALDAVSAIGICSTGAGDEPGRIKNSLFNFEQTYGYF